MEEVLAECHYRILHSSAGAILPAAKLPAGQVYVFESASENSRRANRCRAFLSEL